jgi:hypothetical protein
MGHRHREKVGAKTRAIEEHAAARLRVRRESYCPRVAKAAAKAALPPCFFDDAADSYLHWSRASKKSWKTDEYRLERLKETFGTMRLNEITVDAVEKFKVDVVQQCSRATVNRHLALLRHNSQQERFQSQ